MKTLPILFSTVMVQSILAGNKSQTRRIIKPQPQTGDKTAKPKYQIGDILWVRETFYAYGHWTLITTTLINTVKKEWSFHDLTLEQNKKYLYSDCLPDRICKDRFGLGYFKRPSIFMPRIAARIFLEVTNVRVERLQDISESDAIAEGIETWVEHYCKIRRYRDYISGGGHWENSDYERLGGVHPAIASYRSLWAKINGFESLNSNPWVWVYNFKRIEPPVRN